MMFTKLDSSVLFVFDVVPSSPVSLGKERHDLPGMFVDVVNVCEDEEIRTYSHAIHFFLFLPSEPDETWEKKLTRS